jgi:hypothetical protein
MSIVYNYDTNFDAPDAHFDKLSLFSGTQAKKVGNPAEKVGNPKIKLKTVEEPKKNPNIMP